MSGYILAQKNLTRPTVIIWGMSGYVLAQKNLTRPTVIVVIRRLPLNLLNTYSYRFSDK